jgi:hypothetical protein
MDLNAAPRELDAEINNLRQLIDCRVALKFADLRGNVRTIEDCTVTYMLVGRRRWEGLQVAVHHHGRVDDIVIDVSRPLPMPVVETVRAIFENRTFYTEGIDLDDIVKVRIARPLEDRMVALLECNGVHPFNHFPGEVCPIHFGDEPDQPSVAGWAAPDDIGELTPKEGDDGD